MFLDDDTVLFPLQLPALLAKYNPEEAIYLGNGSEERIQQRLHGWFAQGWHDKSVGAVPIVQPVATGGGGIVLSRGLLRTLLPTWHTIPCLGTSMHGDERLRDCIRTMGVRMRTEPHFHQMDMVWGWFASCGTQ